MREDRRFWFFHALVPLLLFCLLAALFEGTAWDLALSDSFYDLARGGWYFKSSWWASGLIHKGGRYLVVAVALAALAEVVLSFFLERFRPWRRAALYLLLCIGLGTGLVALGKQVTNRHCPWDYDRYGGPVPYVKLYQHTPEGFKRGRGFPAGHASGGFSLMGGYFIFSRRNPRLAWSVLSAGLLLGAIFGFGQLVRGAHFVSHNLWSAMLCWFVSLALYRFAFASRLHPACCSKQN